MSILRLKDDISAELNNVADELFEGITNNDWSRIKHAYELITGEESPSEPESVDVDPQLSKILARLEQLEQSNKANTRESTKKKTVKKKQQNKPVEVAEDFSVNRKPKRQPVVGGENTFDINSVLGDVEEFERGQVGYNEVDDKVSRGRVARPPAKTIAVTCDTCGKNEKVDPLLMSARSSYRCDSCTMKMARSR